MKLNRIKYLTFLIAFLIFTDLKADWTLSVTNNLLGLSNTVVVRVYDASNNLLYVTASIPGNGGTLSVGCTTGVPSYLHVIDAGGCLYSITNLNSTGTCTSCTSCTGFTTATTFTCSEAITSLCTPVTHEITLSVDP